MYLQHGARRVVATTGMLLAVALIASACGGDDDSGSDTPGTTPNSSAGTDSGTGATGEPIKIGMIAPIDSPALSLPGIVEAAKVAVAAVNARGGVDGRPFELITCDDKVDQAAAAGCAQKLLNEDNVLTLTGSLSLVSDATYPAIEAAGAINFGNYPAGAQDLNNPASFPFVAGIAGLDDDLAAALDSMTTLPKTLAVVTVEGAAADATIGPATEVAKERGITLVPVLHAQVVTDFAPIAQKVINTGADAVYLAPNPNQVLPEVQALEQAGFKGQTILSGGADADASLKEITDKGYDPIFGLQMLADPAQSDTFKQYLDEVAKYGDGKVVDKYLEITIEPWLAVTKLADVLAELPDINREELKKYMDAQSDFETGMTHALDFTKPATTAFARTFNSWATAAHVADNAIVVDNVDWVQGVK